MQKFSALALALACIYSLSGSAQSVTPNAGLQVPAFQQSNWQIPIIFDLIRVDNIFGGTVAIPSITLSGPITNASQAATKSYVDGVASGFMQVGGATMTGPLILSGDPTSPLQAVTKEYADAHGGGGGTGGAVSSVFTRTGAVTALSGDYTAAEVTNALDLSNTGTQTIQGSLLLPNGVITALGPIHTTNFDATAIRDHNTNTVIDLSASNGQATFANQTNFSGDIEVASPKSVFADNTVTNAIWSRSPAKTQAATVNDDGSVEFLHSVKADGDLTVNDGTGVGGGGAFGEGTAIAGAAGSDAFWADSTSHRLKMNNNNTGAQSIPGVVTPATAGHFAVFASNGIDLQDGGTGTGGGTSSFTPTHIADAGAGTGGSLSVSFVSGANDDNGYINLTTGASPSANAGVITVTFGGTYTAARKCAVSPASPLATALAGNGFFVGSGTATATSFAIEIGATPLPANTTGYVIYYHCGN